MAEPDGKKGVEGVVAVPGCGGVSVRMRDGRNSSKLASGAAMSVTIVAATPKSAGVFPVSTNRFETKFGFAGPPLVPLPPKAW